MEVSDAELEVVVVAVVVVDVESFVVVVTTCPALVDGSFRAEPTLAGA